MHLHYPDETDDFLAEQKTTDDYQLKVKTNEPVESIAELIGIRASQFFVYHVALERSSILAEFIMILSKAAEFKSARQWLAYIGRHIVNLLYSEKILNEN